MDSNADPEIATVLGPKEPQAFGRGENSADSRRRNSLLQPAYSVFYSDSEFLRDVFNTAVSQHSATSSLSPAQFVFEEVDRATRRVRPSATRVRHSPGSQSNPTYEVVWGMDFNQIPPSQVTVDLYELLRKFAPSEAASASLGKMGGQRLLYPGSSCVIYGHLAEGNEKTPSWLLRDDDGRSRGAVVVATRTPLSLDWPLSLRRERVFLIGRLSTQVRPVTFDAAALFF